MADMMCPKCDTELEHKDAFGNLAYAMFYLDGPHAVKYGDIYRCPECEDYYHVCDNDTDKELRHGYPC